MIDLLIGVGVLAGLSLFAYAVVRAARQQRRRRGDSFRLFAEQRGLELAASGDDAGLREVLSTFEGIGSYQSPSLGEVRPQHVVVDRAGPGRVWVFWHSRRVSEGDALQFYVCLVAGRDFDAEDPGLVLRFGRDRAIGTGVEIGYTGQRRRHDLGERTIEVFDGGDGVGDLLSGEVGRALAQRVGSLPWPVDLQLRPGALALYTTGRNLELSGPEELARLTDVACGIADLLAGSRSQSSVDEVPRPAT